MHGYAADEHLDNEALVKEEHRGIRPASGYPACPEHTESYAMSPPSAVSGFYFSHPDSGYLGVSEIGWDQASEYA